MSSSNYTTKAVYDVDNGMTRCICLYDRGPWDKHKTITNDAEGVIENLIQMGMWRPGVRVFYYDSEKELGELVVRDGKFAGFAVPQPHEVDPFFKQE